MKSKAGDGYGDPAEMVTAQKARRLRRAAEVWLARHPECDGYEVSFELLAVRGRQLERLPDAF